MISRVAVIVIVVLEVIIVVIVKVITSYTVIADATANTIIHEMTPIHISRRHTTSDNHSQAQSRLE